jgi:hypothetical protein
MAQNPVNHQMIVGALGIVKDCFRPEAVFLPLILLQQQLFVCENQCLDRLLGC